MAEIFGAVAGGLSIAALFNNCVDCFGYIQQSRHFGRDFERCQLKLDVARTRLGRWGQAVAINEDHRFANDEETDKVSRQVRAVLEEIVLLFQAVQKSSKRYEIDARQDDLACFEDKDMQLVTRALHDRFGDIARRRQRQTSLLKKAKWALYDGKYLDRLVEQITGFVDDLEKLVPAETARYKLAQVEIEDVDDEPSLLALQDAAAGIDSALSAAVAHKIERIAGRNYAQDIKSDEGARVRVGNEWSESAVAHGVGIADQTANVAGSVSAKGSSAVHIGNVYGERGIFDN